MVSNTGQITRMTRKGFSSMTVESEELAEVMGISNKMLKRLYVRTDNNDLAVLKIVSSLYRRARDLAKLKNSDRLDLDG